MVSLFNWGQIGKIKKILLKSNENSTEIQLRIQILHTNHILPITQHVVKLVQQLDVTLVCTSRIFILVPYHVNKPQLNSLRPGDAYMHQ